MADKKPPEAIPLTQLLRRQRQLPKHRRELSRKARELSVSVAGKGYVEVIEDEYLRLDEADARHRNAQAAKAKKPRGGGVDGRTSSQVVADVVKGHPVDLTPGELLPHVRAALEDNGNRAISDKRAKELIRRVRRTA